MGHNSTSHHRTLVFCLDTSELFHHNIPTIVVWLCTACGWLILRFFAIQPNSRCRDLSLPKAKVIPFISVKWSPLPVNMRYNSTGTNLNLPTWAKMVCFLMKEIPLSFYHKLSKSFQVILMVILIQNFVVSPVSILMAPKLKMSTLGRDATFILCPTEWVLIDGYLKEMIENLKLRFSFNQIDEKFRKVAPSYRMLVLKSPLY